MLPRPTCAVPSYLPPYPTCPNRPTRLTYPNRPTCPTPLTRPTRPTRPYTCCIWSRVKGISDGEERGSNDLNILVLIFFIIYMVTRKGLKPQRRLFLY